MKNHHFHRYHQRPTRLYPRTPIIRRALRRNPDPQKSQKSQKSSLLLIQLKRLRPNHQVASKPPSHYTLSFRYPKACVSCTAATVLLHLQGYILIRHPSLCPRTRSHVFRTAWACGVDLTISCPQRGSGRAGHGRQVQMHTCQERPRQSNPRPRPRVHATGHTHTAHALTDWRRPAPSAAEEWPPPERGWDPHVARHAGGELCMRQWPGTRAMNCTSGPARGR